MFRNVNFIAPRLQAAFSSTMCASSTAIRMMSYSPYSFTQFATKILTANNQQIPVEIKHDYDGGIHHRVSIQQGYDSTKLGFVRYLAWDDHLYILNMEKIASSHKNVGTFLHEYAFRDSIRLGKKGHVRLHAIRSSHYFHFLSGFRPCEAKTLAFNLEELRALQLPREKYLLNPEDKAAEAEVLAILHTKDIVDALKKNTQTVLKMKPTATVSVYQMMQHGFFRTRDVSREWEEKFAALPNSPRKDTSSWGGHDMHYPEASIQQKIELLGLTLPAQSNTQKIYSR
jgi:hypothetical protein